MVTVFLCRHGETDYNKTGIIQGGGIDSDLNETGIQQSRALFAAYGNKPFAGIFASGLKRTQQTLAPWAEAGHGMDHVPGLNEFNWGVLEGQRPDEHQRALFQATLQQWRSGHLHVRMEGGESPVEAWDRSRPFFETLRSDFQGEQVLVCSHGRQIRIMLSGLMGIGLQEMDRFSTHNTGMYVVRIYPAGNTVVETVNDTSHLAALATQS